MKKGKKKKKKKGATAPKSKGGRCWFKTALATAFREDLADQSVQRKQVCLINYPPV